MSTLNPHEWAGRESDLSFNKARHVIDLLNHNFGGDSSVHIGIIYLAVGSNGGRNTLRYLMFLPYYNPAIHGYNFNLQHPFVFARGFPGTASVDFYAWLDEQWTESISASDDNSELLECSPILFCKFDCVDNAEFIPVPWEVSSRGQDTMTAKTAVVECWIHGPMASASMENRIVKSIKEERKSEFMSFLNARNKDQLQALMTDLVTKSNSYSFPTIQMEITSPMTGLVPFALKPVRLKIGGEIAAAGRELNDVHIPVTKPGSAVRRISFQRLWDVLYDPESVEIDAKAVSNMRNSIRVALGY
jgi:hypothetical protein